ncbi:ATP-binding protein [Streptomyces sp. MBT56]|nr:ATP-binding protein [Streptomyces sp. MBT56]MBK3601274.1 ATP-binding protein [Streptomyces sp. MBT54]MBK3615279.1 ATP-binding protein [Streptomyces sp. MBT98]
MFVRATLTRWKLAEYIDDAALIMSELVTNAIKASGITDPDPKPWQIKAEHVIGVQLRAVEASLYVEAWDRTPEPPVRKSPSVEAEGGRGLLLVEQLAKQWNVYRPNVGGKVVWAELPLGLAVEDVPFDTARTPLILPVGLRAARGPVEGQARMALYEQLMLTTAKAMVATRMNDRT